MLTAIAGKIGSGKSILSYFLAQKCCITSADILVNRFYNTEEGISFVKKYFPDAIDNLVICREKLLDALLENEELRLKFEDEMFELLLYPLICEYRQRNYAHYFDGILPRFFHHFDQVIYIERQVEQRKKDCIEKRKVQEDTFNKIDLLQKDFPKILD
jgi:dephospho-CoA kinase